MTREDSQLVIEFMKRRRASFERFMRERGLSEHAAVFIIEDLETTLEAAHERH